MHERHEIERDLRKEAERISERYRGAPVVIVLGGSGQAGIDRSMIASTLHRRTDRLRDLLGLLQVAIQIESRKHFSRRAYTEDDFVSDVLRVAEERGYAIESSRGKGYPQIVFGHKKLHSEHIRQLYPAALEENAHIAELIESIAPGRPCTHRPFREIVTQIRKERGLG